MIKKICTLTGAGIWLALISALGFISFVSLQEKISEKKEEKFC